MSADKEVIRFLNDEFRTGRQPGLGEYTMTPGVAALPPEKQAKLVRLIQSFDEFTEDLDPYREHDLVKVELDGEFYYGKVDYYDLEMKYHSDNPSDPTKCRRVLTLLKVSEW